MFPTEYMWQSLSRKMTVGGGHRLPSIHCGCHTTHCSLITKLVFVASFFSLPQTEWCKRCGAVWLSANHTVVCFSLYSAVRITVTCSLNYICVCPQRILCGESLVSQPRRVQRITENSCECNGEIWCLRRSRETVNSINSQVHWTKVNKRSRRVAVGSRVCVGFIWYQNTCIYRRAGRR